MAEKVIIKHTHNLGKENENCDGNGSLDNCPESTWTEVLLYDGRKARFYHGMSVTMPPDTSQRLRYIDKVEPIE
jgi:hypothetical protein